MTKNVLNNHKATVILLKKLNGPFNKIHPATCEFMLQFKIA